MTARFALVLILGLDAVLLLFEASSLSLTYHGATLLYGDDPGVLARIINASVALFGPSDLALRLPMIVLNLLSAILLYRVSAPYAKHPAERVWLVVLFLLLPGVISASLLVDSAALVIFGLFLYLDFKQRYGHKADFLLPLLLGCDTAFMVLFLGLFVDAVRRRKYAFAGLYALLAAAALWRYGFNTGGLPQNQLLDTLGLYAAVLSPVIFLYLVYVLYRRVVMAQIDLNWSIAATALLLSLLLAFRQRIEIEQFAPYLMAALPLAMQTFYHAYRVRLRQFRKRYRLLFIVAVGTLALNAGAVLFNKAAYLVVSEPERFFAYRAHVAKELADALQAGGVECAAFPDDPKMQLRLRFYGIESCRKYRIEKQSNPQDSNVTIRYYGVEVASFHVTKMPN